MPALLEKKMTICGDSFSGKTTLCMAHLTQEYPKRDIPSVIEPHLSPIQVDDIKVDLMLWDIGAGHGEECASSVKPLSYTNVLVMVYSVVSRQSFESILDKWHPMKEKICPECPLILVGNKTDIRDDEALLKTVLNNNEDKKPVTKEEGEELAKKINATVFLECSAKFPEEVENVFYTAATLAKDYESPNKENEDKNECVIS